VTFEISQPGKYVDGIETESFEFASQIDSYRGLAGVVHLYDKVYSSETGANTMNYQLGLDFYNQIIFTQFAAGVTKTVLHGFTSIRGSEGDTDWPGHEGMWPTISERFDERQPYYRFTKDWTAMIARYQRLLRSGKACRDVAIIRTDYNFWNLLMVMARVTGGTEKDLYEKSLMRANEGIYWKDPSMQNAGYSYDYFAPQLLEDPDVKFGNKQIQPDGPAYKAIVLYQEGLPLDSAKVILNYAKKGLPVILVNGVTETINMFTDVKHNKAASATPFNDGKDTELAAVIAELKKLPNVRETDDPSAVAAILKELAVEPCAGFTESNSKILTLMREDTDYNYVYAYHYMYTDTGSYNATLKIKGEGAPYYVDCWTGEIKQVELYEIKDGYTFIPITLCPGEAAIYALDKKSTAASKGITTIPSVRDNIALTIWDLKVESWSKGAKQEITEDRGLGYVTKEVYYETDKKMITVGKTTLKPWKDIPEVGPTVSGLGFYQTSFELPTDWDDSEGAILEIESTAGNAAAVYVNGKKAIFDYSRGSVDITALLKSGENTLLVEVASTLANQLISTGFYEIAGPKTVKLMQIAMGHELTFQQGDGEPTPPSHPVPTVQDYGMLGSACIKFYTKINT